MSRVEAVRSGREQVAFELEQFRIRTKGKADV